MVSTRALAMYCKQHGSLSSFTSIVHMYVCRRGVPIALAKTLLQRQYGFVNLLALVTLSPSLSVFCPPRHLSTHSLSSSFSRLFTSPKRVERRNVWFHFGAKSN